MDESRPVEEILDAIGDDRARGLLAAVAVEPRPAKRLAEACDMSLPTVYRRLETLADHDLVVERTEVADDGNHYAVYECNFDSTVVRLDDDGEYDVRVYRRANAPDRFKQLWDDLAGGGE